MTTKSFTANRKFTFYTGNFGDGTRRAEDRFFKVDLTIDLDALIDHLGRQAATNKSGKSKIQGGMITATATRLP